MCWLTVMFHTARVSYAWNTSEKRMPSREQIVITTSTLVAWTDSSNSIWRTQRGMGPQKHATQRRRKRRWGFLLYSLFIYFLAYRYSGTPVEDHLSNKTNLANETTCFCPIMDICIEMNLTRCSACLLVGPDHHSAKKYWFWPWNYGKWKKGVILTMK
jgi:hypothetical protein